MKVSATQKHARMSPRKIRPYARMIQGMTAEQATVQLAFAQGKAPVILAEVLQSAIANATNNLQIPVGDLKVASVLVNQGLVMKRFMPVSKGMAHSILKRTAHVTVTVEGDVKEVASKKKAAPKKVEKIQTVTADQFVKQEKKEAEKREQELTHNHSGKHETEERSVETVADKKSGEAFQKMKMNQKGGDAKKTHRRKSIG